jgi:cell division protease FtsH
VFLGRDFTSRRRDYSETIANQIDDEVRKFVLEAHAKARELLDNHRTVLEQLAVALLERETLDAEEVDAIVAGRDLPTREKVVIPSYSDREKAAKDKRRAASIFGAPKPAPST